MISRRALCGSSTFYHILGISSAPTLRKLSPSHRSTVMAEADADIIIVGAGTAGLLLAEKLSRDPLLRVLVFEAGNDCTGHPDTQNVFTYFQNFGSERDWHFESIPQVRCHPFLQAPRCVTLISN